MKGIVRLFFWVMLVFLTNICFAEKEEEFKELNDHLLIPIVTHFSGGKGSATDQIWKMLMDMQTSEGRQFVKKDRIAKRTWCFQYNERLRMQCRSLRYKR